MATGTEMPGLAGEGEELFVAAVGTLKSRESSGEIAAAVELAHDLHGIGPQGTVDGAMAALVAGLELGPGVVNDVPEWRGARTAGSVDGGHKCFLEHLFLRLTILFTYAVVVDCKIRGLS